MDWSGAPVGDALVALADPTRRAMVELLAERPRRVGELVAAFPVSQPAISRHLRVLRRHGLVEEQVPAGDRRGRVYRLRPDSLDPLAGWLDQVRRFWADHLEQFRSYVEHEQGGREMAPEPVVSQSVEVPADPGAAFELYTAGINRWWRRDSWYWNDRERARGLRIEPFVGGRFVEVWDEASGEGFEIGRVRAWEPGRRVTYSWRQADWPPGEEMEIEVTFAPAAGGTLVTVNVRGWERLTGGEEIGRGYGEGAKELLGWYAEAAAAG
jgi:DNA-binding transcriptional ArsR family regulator/uncharacterized protein YndB with AHSA1/START domain